MRTGSKSAPREIWRQQIGGIQSRNTMVSDGTRLFVGTCGDTWNRRDRHDGVYCLGRANGNILWFTPTTADVNEICLAGSSLLVPTDAGDVFVLDAITGDVINVYRVDAPVLGSPCVSDNGEGWTAVFVSLAGTVYALREQTGNIVVLGQIDGSTRASLVQIETNQFVAATENGSLFKLAVHEDQIVSREIARVPPDTTWGGPVSVTARPLMVGNKLYVGYARCTSFDDPAVFCVDLTSEQIVWIATAEKSDVGHFGNVRTTPALVGNRLVVASAYTDGVDIIDANTGRFVQRVVLGQNVFQQWSSPANMTRGRIAIGRVDGVCSIVSVSDATLVASVSLATAETERLSTVNSSIYPGDTNFALYPGEPAPEGGICGTPLFDRDTLFVGTTDGVVVGVRPDGWSSYH